MAHGRRWTREEDLAVLYGRHIRLEHYTGFAELAEAMGRTRASVWMRKGNFDSLDPSVSGSGLKNAAKLTQCIWAEYQRNPQQILRQARKAYERIRTNGRL